MKPRMLVWFSCGAPSAIASKLALATCSETHEIKIVNCDTRSSEHPDNYRFSSEVEHWLGVPIIYLQSTDYKTVDDVFEQTLFMASPKGARCTTELKKIPRLKFARPDDVHVFGYTIEEIDRARDFELYNPDLLLRWLLIELRLKKRDCLNQLRRAGITEPAMYQLGFDNNNCPGCVKASSPWYWSMIRKHFPEVFKRRCEQSRAIGCKLVEIRHHVRIFLDELPPGDFPKKRRKENLSCGPQCSLNLSV